MPAIKLGPVKGLAPSVKPKNLDTNSATRAQDVSIRHGDVRPRKVALGVATAGSSNPKTIYRFQRTSGGAFNTDATSGWVSKATDVDFVRGQVADDTTERTYFTGDGVPKVLDASGVERTLGVPAPGSTPTVARNVVDEYTFAERDGEILKIKAAMTWQMMISLDEVYVGATDYATHFVKRDTANFFTGPDEAPFQVVRGYPTTGSGSTLKLTEPIEYGWTLDPSLDGFYHTGFWCLPITWAGRMFTVGSSMSTNLQSNLWLSGPSAGQPIVNSTQAGEIVTRLGEILSATDPFLVQKQQEFNALFVTAKVAFNNGVAPQVKNAVVDFYATSEVVAVIDAAKNNFADEVYSLADKLVNYQEFGLGA